MQIRISQLFNTYRWTSVSTSTVLYSHQTIRVGLLCIGLATPQCIFPVPEVLYCRCSHFMLHSLRSARALTIHTRRKTHTTHKRTHHNNLYHGNSIQSICNVCLCLLQPTLYESSQIICKWESIHNAFWTIAIVFGVCSSIQRHTNPPD